jgi:hypothetical protein
MHLTSITSESYLLHAKWQNDMDMYWLSTGVGVVQSSFFTAILTLSQQLVNVRII